MLAVLCIFCLMAGVSALAEVSQRASVTPTQGVVIPEGQTLLNTQALNVTTPAQSVNEIPAEVTSVPGGIPDPRTHHGLIDPRDPIQKRLDTPSSGTPPDKTPSTSGSETYVYVTQWGSYGTGIGQFDYPQGIAVNADGYVYVTDANNNRVQKFTSTGTYVTQWGSYGTGIGQFNYPDSIAVSADGYVYITDESNNRIQKFTSTGTYVTQWGSYGTGIGQFYFPYGIAVSADGYVYVTDANNNRVQYVTQWGSYGTGIGQFYYPYGIAVSANGNVYVVDFNNNRVQEFTSTGTYVTQWGSYGTGNGQFSSPNGVAVDASGNVYVADCGNNRIQEFTSTGTYVMQWGFYGAGIGQFNDPETIAVNANDGNIYIADSRNDRVQKFAPSSANPPVANFVGTPTSGTAPLTVTFTDISTNTPTSWSWDFWDGSSENATERNPVHTYASAGTYAVSLTATNAAGSNTKTSDSYISVKATAPVANFAGTPTYGKAPLTVQFTDSSSNTPTGWAWFFGDETYTASWTQQTASAGWSGREAHSSVAMPDGSIVLMGGINNIVGLMKDVWRSTDNGVTWTQQTASAGWSARELHSSVVMPDGSIVLMGGYDGNYYHIYKNDVWRSIDNGATWNQMNASAGWSGRSFFSSVAMPDGSIVLMGGWSYPYNKLCNDVWRSTDKGATWTQMTASAGWSARYLHSSVAMPDGSIVLMGGQVWGGYKNDVWRSTDNGATWTQQTATAGWSARNRFSSVAMPDGSIVLMGGCDNSYDSYKNDVWRFMPVGSSARNPSHTYTATGIYPVALQAYNTGGYNSIRKTGYITVTAESGADTTGVYRPGTGFYLKKVAGSWSPTQDQYLTWDTATGDLPISGDWNNDGYTETGVYRPGAGFYLKKVAGAWDPTQDQYLTWDTATGDLPISGFYLKKVAGAWDPTQDQYLSWDTATGDLPISGDWNNDGYTETGVYRPGSGFYLKKVAGSWSPTQDQYLTWDTAPDDLPIAGNFI
ncbi:MAG: PKD domain-containing protein [Methanoregula sp.]|nr:PKD domain-containing protein [Methanoregula sp.]